MLCVCVCVCMYYGVTGACWCNVQAAQFARQSFYLIKATWMQHKLQHLYSSSDTITHLSRVTAHIRNILIYPFNLFQAEIPPVVKR